MKVSTRPAARIAAASMFAMTSVMGVAAASADDPAAPSGPSISVHDDTVDQFQSIEVTGQGFDSTAKGVKVAAKQVVVADPDPEVVTPEPFEAVVNAGDAASDGSLPPQGTHGSGSTERDFAEIYTDESWPAGDYEIVASYVDAANQKVTTDAVRVVVAESKRAPHIESDDFDKDGRIEAGKAFTLVGVGSPLVDEQVSVTLHGRGQTIVIKRYDSNVLTLLQGVLTGTATFVVPDGLRDGEYAVQLATLEDPKTTTFARLPLTVKAQYVPAPPTPPAVPDPEPVKEVAPPVVDKPTLPTSPPPVVATPRQNEGPKVSKPPRAPRAEPVARAPKQTAPLEVGGADDAKVKPKPRADANTADAPDPKPSTADEPELEALPGLQFDQPSDEVVDATLAGAPQSKSISATPLIGVLAAMGVLVGGVTLAMRRFNVA